MNSGGVLEDGQIFEVLVEGKKYLTRLHIEYVGENSVYFLTTMGTIPSWNGNMYILGFGYEEEAQNDLRSLSAKLKTFRPVNNNVRITARGRNRAGRKQPTTMNNLTHYSQYNVNENSGGPLEPFIAENGIYVKKPGGLLNPENYPKYRGGRKTKRRRTRQKGLRAARALSHKIQRTLR